MILTDILLAKRINGFFYVEGFKIKADRVSTPGYGVLVVFEPSKLDKDFRVVLGPGRFAWFPTAKAINIILEKLDLSDRFTVDLRKGKGWNVGPRPFKLADLI
jgi:hypothetical protein